MLLIQKLEEKKQYSLKLIRHRKNNRTVEPCEISEWAYHVHKYIYKNVRSFCYGKLTSGIMDGAIAFKNNSSVGATIW